jgi:hypothetical protein
VENTNAIKSVAMAVVHHVNNLAIKHFLAKTISAKICVIQAFVIHVLLLKKYLARVDQVKRKFSAHQKLKT